MVTFFSRPNNVTAQNDWALFFKQHLSLFDRNQTKHLFKCDAFFIDLSLGPYSVVNLTRYWFGLFSHQRVSAVWKGMLEIHLNGAPDDKAIQLLDSK
jgi:hypothetical protein